MKNSPIEELDAYHQAGIAVLAKKYEITIRQLSLALCGGGPVLEPIGDLADVALGAEFMRTGDITDYVTACLGGVAGRFIRADARRSQFANSFGRGGFEMEQIRRVLECVDRETDRAFAIVFASLGKMDGGDAEGTLYRLWKRADRELREAPQREQLDRVARELLKVERLTGEDVHRLLKNS